MKVNWRGVWIAVALVLAVAAVAFTPTLLRRMAFFRVRQVEIVGARYLDESDVVRHLALPVTASIFDRLEPTRRAALAVPGVLGATIERRLPGTLRIIVREASPVALTALSDRLALMDSAGAVLPFDPTRVPASLPIAVQDSSVAALLARVKQADRALYDRIDTAELDHGDVVLAVGVRRIRLRPEADSEVLHGVSAVIDNLTKNATEWRGLDARYRNRVFVQKGAA